MFTMKDYLENFIRSRVKSLNKREVQEILDIFHEKEFKKGELFKKRDTRSEEVCFIIKGATRTYQINNKGEEVTIFITQENNFETDLVSIRTKEKTPIIIEFLADSLTLVAPVVKFTALLQRNLTFNLLLREYSEDRTVELGKRHVMFLNGTAKERYQDIIKNNPGLLKKFPLRYIASIIGVTPTQLSRIRNAKE